MLTRDPGPEGWRLTSLRDPLAGERSEALLLGVFSADCGGWGLSGHPMRLQPVLLPDPMDGGRAEPDLFSRPPGTPVGGTLRPPHRRTHYRTLLGRADGPPAPTAGSAPKPGDAQLAKAPPPQTDGRSTDLQPRGQLADTFAVSATDHNPRPLRQPLRDGCRAQPGFQLRPFRFAHFHPACLYCHAA